MKEEAIKMEVLNRKLNRGKNTCSTSDLRANLSKGCRLSSSMSLRRASASVSLKDEKGIDQNDSKCGVANCGRTAQLREN